MNNVVKLLGKIKVHSYVRLSGFFFFVHWRPVERMKLLNERKEFDYKYFALLSSKSLPVSDKVIQKQ